MTAAIRLEVAREQVAAMIDADLARYSKWRDLTELAWRVNVPFGKLQLLIDKERLKRGLITLQDIPPSDRRGLIDESNIDLHALASGPIMHIDALYCPLGKLSMAETRAREAATILPNQGEANGRGA